MGWQQAQSVKGVADALLRSPEIQQARESTSFRTKMQPKYDRDGQTTSHGALQSGHQRMVQNVDLTWMQSFTSFRLIMTSTPDLAWHLSRIAASTRHEAYGAHKMHVVNFNTCKFGKVILAHLVTPVKVWVFNSTWYRGGDQDRFFGFGLERKWTTFIIKFSKMLRTFGASRIRVGLLIPVVSWSLKLWRVDSDYFCRKCSFLYIYVSYISCPDLALSQILKAIVASNCSPLA